MKYRLYRCLFNDGKVRFQLMREDIPVAKRVRMAFMLNTR